jgi:hypothetical protein
VLFRPEAIPTIILENATPISGLAITQIYLFRNSL